MSMRAEELKEGNWGAGAVPFVEGEVAAMVGVVGGINPIIAGVSAAVGNFVSVLLVVLLTSRAGTAVVDRRAARVAVTAGAVSSAEAFAAEKPQSKGRAKFKRWLARYPGRQHRQQEASVILSFIFFMILFLGGMGLMGIAHELPEFQAITFSGGVLLVCLAMAFMMRERGGATRRTDSWGRGTPKN